MSGHGASRVAHLTVGQPLEPGVEADPVAVVGGEARHRRALGVLELRRP